MCMHACMHACISRRHERRSKQSLMATGERGNKRICLDLTRRPLRSGRHVVPTAHRKLLLEVAFKLRPCEVEELRFSVADAVPDEIATDSLTTLGLLECLERHKLLRPGEYSTLRGYLEGIGRGDLADLLAPPEELGGSPRPPPSGTLSRIATCLQVDSVVWPYSTYRQSVLNVFRDLGGTEVEQIRWLSQDFLDSRLKTSWLQEMTGNELLNVLDNSGLVGPGNYSFLIDCLEEVGRPDLMVHLLPPSLPHLPASMGLPALLHQKHIESILLKKIQYQFGMKNLKRITETPSQITAKHAGDYYRRIVEVLSQKSLGAHSSYILQKLPETLINMSLHLNDLLDAQQEYESNGDTAKFVQHVSDCQEHLNTLQELMEEIDWDNVARKRERNSTSRQYHPVRQASYGAFSGIAELLLEFSGSREQLQEESRQLSHTLTRLESLLFLCGYMWSLTSWLIASLQVAVCSPVYLGDYDFLVRLLVQRNRRIICSNSRMLETVLGPTAAGKQLLKCICGNNSSKEVDETVNPFHTAATPFPVFAFVLLLLSEQSSFSVNDMEEIIVSLKRYVGGKEETFCQIYHHMTGTVLQSICRKIEVFRSAKLQEVHIQGIEDIFSV